MPFFILTLKCCYCNIKKILYFFIIYLFMLFQAVFRDRQLTGKYKPSKMEYHQVRPQFLVKHIFSNKNISWEGRFFLQKVLIRLWSIFFSPKSRYFSSKSFSREGRYSPPKSVWRESRYFSKKDTFCTWTTIHIVTPLLRTVSAVLLIRNDPFATFKSSGSGSDDSDPFYVY